MNAHQIKHMVDRFLFWKLPEDFAPDCGIYFDADAAKKMNPLNHRYEPAGTNLFDAQQVDAMVRYMVEGLPDGSSDRASAMTGARGCDPKCVDLALHFLSPGASNENAYRLALHIQEQVEDWIDDQASGGEDTEPKSEGK